MAAILIVEDELVLAHQVATALRSGGHDVLTADCAKAGLEIAAEHPPDVVLLDLRLPDRSGLDVITQLKELDPHLQVVLMTAYGSVRDAVEAMRRGAADYLNKPLDLGELGLLIDRLLLQERRERELAHLRGGGALVERIVPSTDPRMKELFAQVDRLCDVGLEPGRRPVILLTGETGTGKGVVARAIHERLGGGAFIEVGCSSAPAATIEAELFGRERGVGEDAAPSRPGLFEAAEGGSIVLDGIDDLGPQMQTSFLRLIEDKRVRRLGSSRDREINVHVLATAQSDLEAAVEAGRFRADLLHRLRVLSFEIPPLRERTNDIPALARHFAESLGRKYGGLPRSVSPEAMECLARYPWPGNVRELRNVLERAVLLHDDEQLGVDVLSAMLATDAVPNHGRVSLPDEGVRLDDVERDLLQQALARASGNQTRASALLGLSRDTFRYRAAKWGLGKDTNRD